MNITVFGTGYVGLVVGACLADGGHDVVCVDVDESRVAALQNGKVPIYEPGLESMVGRTLAEGHLQFTTDTARAVEFGQLLFIAVGTPPDDDGSVDLNQVLDVAAAIGKHMQTCQVIVIKSTVPVGTADTVRDVITLALARRGVELSFDVCSNPEFLKEGSAIEDFTRAARIVVGTDSVRVREVMLECYAPYNRKQYKMVFMDVRSAELTKYAANAMLATKISFMNEVANLAERVGADVEQVRRGIGSDPRIGYDFIYPGCGFGGSCLPKDLQALIRTADKASCDTSILRAVETVNRRQKGVLFEKLNHAFGGELRGKTIAVWGLAFKANTDDMREAPSRTLLEALWSAGASVQAFDPAAMEEAERIYGRREDLRLVRNRDDAVVGADALVICTEWNVFRTVEFGWLRSQLRQPVVVDGRNLFEPREMRRAGIRYYAVGRGEYAPSA
ncbi:MAG: UDP-glucose/GDP-mannose dehydrogenase family protein [Dehalococcoidia bacterium]|nr:UDP-glucose/GDP-mannose dehydrogenase family protein [Dehalococcoidia bacterium]